MKKNKYLIVLAGATASGKTGVGIQMAQHFKTEILSSDSRQFYREMTIGTAKPDANELDAVKHHFIDNLSIHDAYSVGDYEKEAIALLEKLFQKQDIVFMVGGTGLFIRAVCEGLDVFPDVPLTIREEVEEEFNKLGIEALQRELQRIDPQYHKEVDLQNPHRLIRAISVYRASGQPYTSFRTKSKTDRFFQSIYLCLYQDREKLYNRINKRVDLMMEAGLLEEAKSLKPYKNKTALQTVGYQELFDFFDGKVSLNEAVENIKQNSRRYAKRQGTWFRKNPHWFYFKPAELEVVYQYLDFFINENIRITRATPLMEPAIKSFIKTLEIEDARTARDLTILIFKNEEIIALAVIEVRKKKKQLRSIEVHPQYTNLPVEEWLSVQVDYYLNA